MSADAAIVVLIVEDEPLILMLLADYLSGEGYRVLTAENGEQAFEILATKPHLDLMIPDYRLPGGVSGVQIAEPAIMLPPQWEVVFIRGYPAEVPRCASPPTPTRP
ncbi:response regulator, partial [Pseudomonas syringae]